MDLHNNPERWAKQMLLSAFYENSSQRQEAQGEVYIHSSFSLTWGSCFFPESSVTMTTEDWKPRELMLLILCITLGILCLGLLISMAFIFLKVKGKYGRCRVLGVTGKA